MDAVALFNDPASDFAAETALPASVELDGVEENCCNAFASRDIAAVGDASLLKFEGELASPVTLRWI